MPNSVKDPEQISPDRGLGISTISRPTNVVPTVGGGLRIKHEVHAARPTSSDG